MSEYHAKRACNTALLDRMMIVVDTKNTDVGGIFDIMAVTVIDQHLAAAA